MKINKKGKMNKKTQLVDLSKKVMRRSILSIKEMSIMTLKV